MILEDTLIQRDCDVCGGGWRFYVNGAEYFVSDERIIETLKIRKTSGATVEQAKKTLKLLHGISVE